MAKKYVPSGYQIIHLDINGETIINFTDNEDSKVLGEILVNASNSLKIVKPILLSVYDTSDDRLYLGIPSIVATRDDVVSLQLTVLSGNFLQINYNDGDTTFTVQTGEI